MFIDTHAHIYSSEFSSDREEMIKRAKADGITAILMPNIDSQSVGGMMELAKEYSFCFPMMGLHPCHVRENYLEELAQVEDLLRKHPYIAVGEIGIDLYWDKTFVEEQEFAYRKQIELAREFGLPVVIHSRDSLHRTIGILEEMQDGTLRGVFHCFNGSINDAVRIQELGFYMGIGGVITYKNAGVDVTVADIPLDWLMLETDAPYLSPVPHRGKRNECSYIRHVAERLAAIKQVTLEEVGRITTENATKLFKLNAVNTL
jgi:TatD DNase family protein